MQIEDLHITDEWAIDPVRKKKVALLIARLIRNEEQAFFYFCSKIKDPLFQKLQNIWGVKSF